MTSPLEPAPAIFLLAIEDAGSGPLRRWIGREAWRTDPVVSLYYEPDGDRILFRLIDSPSAASGFLSAGQPPDPAVGMFMGFDGTSGDSWPTTIALQDFGWHAQWDTSQFSVLREIVGGTALAAAAGLQGTPGGRREVRISPDEADLLVKQWEALVIAGLSDEALYASLAAWSAAPTTREQGGPEPGQAVVPGPAGPTLGAPRPPAVAYALARGDLSRSRPSERRSSEGSWPAGSSEGTDQATMVGAVMARTSSPAHDRPRDDLPYGLFDRLADIVAAWRDGRAGAPPLPEPGQPYDPADPRLGMTPFLEIRNRHFGEQAEREHERMLNELAVTFRRRTEIKALISDAEERAKELHIHLEGMPAAPAGPPDPNALEMQLGVSEPLIRARRQREFTRERRRIADLEEDALKAAAELRREDSDLAGKIETRERIRDARVRQLLQHSRRRCGTYMQHIVHHHPDSSAVLHYLELRLPTAPDWLPQPATTVAQPAGPPSP